MTENNNRDRSACASSSVSTQQQQQQNRYNQSTQQQNSLQTTSRGITPSDSSLRRINNAVSDRQSYYSANSERHSSIRSLHLFSSSTSSVAGNGHNKNSSPLFLSAVTANTGDFSQQHQQQEGTGHFNEEN